MRTKLLKSCLGKVLGVAIGLALLPGSMMAQPVVQVPQNCNVVVTGTGTGVSPGFGGTVGRDGIVLMPDPYPGQNGGTFTLIVPSPYTSGAWRLLGDLSFYGDLIGTHDNAIQLQGSGLSANILSYNKKGRKSENEDGSHYNLARSKGRVSIAYEDTASNCGSYFLTFDVYKTYIYIPGDTAGAYVPPIIGPPCWLPGETYTYSVDQVASDNLMDAIGLDQYYWTVEDNDNNQITNFYTSADVSSITIIAPDTLNPPYVITACFGRGNDWDGNSLSPTHTTCLTKVIGGQPVMPTITYPDCLSVGDTGFMAVVTPYEQSYTYSWATFPNTWSVSANPNGDTAVVSITSGNQDPGSITLTVTGCSPVDTTFHIGRSFDGLVGIYASPATACYNAQDIVTFSTTPSSVSNNFTNWIFPAGWTVLNYTNSAHSIVKVQIPDTAAGGLYVIKAYACDSSYIVTDTINVRPQTPTIDDGAVCIDFGSTTQINYSVNETGIYQWHFPIGWMGSSSSNIISLTPDGIHSGVVSAVAVSSSGCNSLDSVVWNVNFNPVMPVGFNTVPCWNFGTGIPVNVTVSNAPTPFFGTYEVIDSTGTFLSATPSVNASGVISLPILASAPAGSYTLYVTHTTNDCGNSDTVPIVVNYEPKGNTGTPFISMDTTWSDYGIDGYVVSNILPFVPVQWFLNGSPVSTQFTYFIEQSQYTLPATICAQFTVSGCTSRICIDVTQYQSLMGGGESEKSHKTSSNAMTLSNVEVYPNPNNGSFTVNIPAFETDAMLYIYDINGKLLNTRKLTQGSNTLKENLTTGTYILLFTIDGKTSGKKIQVN